ncbi:MAG: hypothetical protein U5K77_01485 [Candidatus Saccharibacteria bacterium]|nr:hypothetical protein [Candidatus Saccharibacteria bacterium]
MIGILPKREWPIEHRIMHYFVTFLRLSVVAAIFVAFSASMWEELFFYMLTLILMLLPAFISSKISIKLPVEFDLILALFVYLSVFLGSVGGAYYQFWWWDAMLHISAGFILGFAGFLALYLNMRQRKIRAGRWFIGICIFLFAVALGAIWEIYEFVVDGLLGFNMQRDLDDTMWDMIVNAVGALVVAVAAVQYIDKPKRGFIAPWVHRFVQKNPRLIRRIK